jgi:N-ethylmaleimide reductase
VTRFANNWPLNPEAEMSTWYSPTGENGYIDFPVAQEANFKN